MTILKLGLLFSSIGVSTGTMQFLLETKVNKNVGQKFGKYSMITFVGMPIASFAYLRIPKANEKNFYPALFLGSSVVLCFCSIPSHLLARKFLITVFRKV